MRQGLDIVRYLGTLLLEFGDTPAGFERVFLSCCNPLDSIARR